MSFPSYSISNEIIAIFNRDGKSFQEKYLSAYFKQSVQ